MNHATVYSQEPVLLVGGGETRPDLLETLIPRCSLRVAADGGAGTLLQAGILPDAVIGDLDSLSETARGAIPAERIHHIPEQDSTDFDKCLRNIDAPLVCGTGFLGPRVDHQLAALTVLARRADRRCLLAGSEDVIALAPPRITLDLPAGTRFSLYPLAELHGESSGLRWPLEGIRFAPDLRTGTSNETTGGHVSLSFDAPAMLIILPVTRLPQLAEALLAAPDAWPARA